MSLLSHYLPVFFSRGSLRFSCFLLRVQGLRFKTKPKAWKGFSARHFNFQGHQGLPLEDKAIQHVLVKVPTTFSVQLDEQHIHWGWELLCWNWPWPEQYKQLCFLESALLYQLEEVSSAADWPCKALQQVGSCSAPSGP